MSEPISPLHPQPISLSLSQSLAARLRNYLLAGILVTAPLAITLYAAWSVVDYVDEKVAAVLPDRYNPNHLLPFAIPGLGLIILLIALIVIGFLTANFLGRMFVRAGERIVARMPIVRSFYSGIKQIFETLFSDHAKSFSEVVIVEFSRKGMWTLGLVIGPAPAEISERTGKAMFNVYLPTTLNPTSGYLVFLPRDEITHLDMTVEECLKMIISGGIVMPQPSISPTAKS